MDSAIAAAVATLASAISTAILMYAAYKWPRGRNEHDDEMEEERRRENRRHAHKEDRND